MEQYLLFIALVSCVCLFGVTPSGCYSAFNDIQNINSYNKNLRKSRLIPINGSAPSLDHAIIARTLVHQANWAAVGTISTNPLVLGYPMVNIISIDDADSYGSSTGKIHFMLTDLDFTGPDWRNYNKVTFLFSDEQNLHCKMHKMDPMEPTCARVIVSGQIQPMDKNDESYDEALVAFVQRHEAAKRWIRAHNFYLCELKISNLFVLDYYGGPHNVSAEDYYSVKL